MPPFVEGNAKVAELVDALDSGSSGHYACGGSSPPFRTMCKQISIIGILLLIAGSYGCKSELEKLDEQLQGIHDQVFQILKDSAPDGKKAVEEMNKLEVQTRASGCENYNFELEEGCKENGHDWRANSRKELRDKYLKAKSSLSPEARDAKNAESQQRWRENATKIETLVKRYEEPERSTLKRLVGQITSAR
jgi:hypothetical protein